MDNVYNDVMGYLDKAFTGVKPLIGAALGVIGYVMFPDGALQI